MMARWRDEIETFADETLTLALFLGFFACYLASVAPALAPYRDAGEMVCLIGTLGVAHPPGYPLYTLMAQLARWVPLGNLAFRLNVFSALCAAGALALLYAALRPRLGRLPSVVAAVLLGLSNPFWELATVSEMYALGALWVCLLMWAFLRSENPTLVMFLWGLGLGVRMDLLLLGAALAVAWAPHARRLPYVSMAVAFALGASVIFYLLVRSRQDPWIDWGNPDTLDALFRSVTRKSYSGRLDLLSLSYKPGENFGINMALYARHLLTVMGPLGIGAALGGAAALAFYERRLFLPGAAAFFVTGPLFLFLANMPPNPHAYAIVEASYLVPDILVAAAAAGAVAWLLRPRLGPRAGQAGRVAAFLFLAALFLNAPAAWARASKRDNYAVRDYITNVLRSLPEGTVLAAQKDVQLFSLWHAQLIEQRRPDVSLISIGLSASPWYWDMMRRWPTALPPEINLKEDDPVGALISGGGARPVRLGFDADVGPMSGAVFRPGGFVIDPAPANAARPADRAAFLAESFVWRGARQAGLSPDFFTTDLLSEAARAFHQQGFADLMDGNSARAEMFFARAAALDPLFPRAWTDRGYLLFLRGDYAGAQHAYEEGQWRIQKMLDETGEYRSLPSVVTGLRRDLATNFSQRGVCFERLGNVDQARQSYEESLAALPTAQAHYNLAVTYWNRDWSRVREHLTAALAIDPTMNDARRYLARVPG